MKRSYLFILICVFLYVQIPAAQQINSLTAEQKSWLANANRHERNGWIYLHIEGEAEERGFQHGYLLANEIEEGIRVLKTEWEYESAMEWSWLVNKAAVMFTPKVDSEYLVEINGIMEGMKAAGVSTSRDELVCYNGWIELIDYWWPTVKDSICPNSPNPKKESCSSFIATGDMTSDGGIVLGHNTWTDYWVPLCNIVIDIQPKKGHRILMQTTPGFIHSGTDFFVTDAGLVGSETTIADFFPFDKTGVPEFTRMRYATQYASSIDEWCEIMKKENNGGYANAWILGDINTNEIAYFELGLKYVGFEKKKNGYFTGSNVPDNLKILRFETKMKELDIKDPCISRRVRWKQLMKENAGKIDIEKAKLFLADHYDTYLNTEKLDSRTLCGHWSLDPDSHGSTPPFSPGGVLDGKVIDSHMAKKMAFIARWGSSCGTPFIAKQFLANHPQFECKASILRDFPTEPWTEFMSGEK